MTQDNRVRDFVAAFEGLRAEVEKVIVGHRDIINHVLIGLFAGGHVLLEGVPGLGKTLLVKTLAEGLELSFSRDPVHAGPDAGRHHRHQRDLRGRTGRRAALPLPAGPVFANIVLADEINRATPKTQSALLEAMQERTRHRRATHRIRCRRRSSCWPRRTRSRWKGTYPLPEAQLDRFLFKLRVRVSRRARS